MHTRTGSTIKWLNETEETDDRSFLSRLPISPELSTPHIAASSSADLIRRVQSVDSISSRQWGVTFAVCPVFQGQLSKRAFKIGSKGYAEMQASFATLHDGSLRQNPNSPAAILAVSVQG